jgi:hypothetical protein
MPEGYVIRPRGNFALPQEETALFDDMARLGRGKRLPRLSSGERADIRCTLHRFDVETVVVGPMPVGRAPTVAFFAGVLGRRPVQGGGVAYWPNVSGVSGCS